MNNTKLHNALPSSDKDAEFIGYQVTKSGRMIPLYNIVIEHHPLRGSTVSEESLRALKLRIPQITDKVNPEK